MKKFPHCQYPETDMEVQFYPCLLCKYTTTIVYKLGDLRFNICYRHSRDTVVNYLKKFEVRYLTDSWEN